MMPIDDMNKDRSALPSGGFDPETDMPETGMNDESAGPDDNFAPEADSDSIDVIESDPSVETVGGDNADSVRQAGLDLDGDPDNLPGSDNPNDLGEDESLG